MLQLGKQMVPGVENYDSHGAVHQMHALTAADPNRPAAINDRKNN